MSLTILIPVQAKGVRKYCGSLVCVVSRWWRSNNELTRNPAVHRKLNSKSMPKRQGAGWKAWSLVVLLASVTGSLPGAVSILDTEPILGAGTAFP